MVRKLEKEIGSRVRSLRIHNTPVKVKVNGKEGDKDVFSRFEYSESPAVNSLFHQTPLLPTEDSEDGYFWSTRVQLFDMEDSAFLYFDDRPTVRDALLLLWNILRPNTTYNNSWVLAQGLFSPALAENYQISYFLSDSSSNVLYLRENDTERSICFEPQRKFSLDENEDDELENSYEYSSEDEEIDSDIISSDIEPFSMPKLEFDKKISLLRFNDSCKPLPSSPLAQVSSPRYNSQTNTENSSTTKATTENEENFAADSNLEENESSRTDNILAIDSIPTDSKTDHIFRHFLVIVRDLSGNEKFLSLSLDLHVSVFTTIQRIVNAPNTDQNITDNNTEYGIFVPQIREDIRVAEQDLDSFPLCTPVKLENGYWLSNDSSLESSVSQMDCKTQILFVKPRETPREILVKVLPPVELCSDDHNDFQDIALKVDNIGVATMVFSPQCTVQEAIESISRTSLSFLPSPPPTSAIPCLVWEGITPTFRTTDKLLKYLNEQEQEEGEEQKTKKLLQDRKLVFYFDKANIPTSSTPNGNLTSSESIKVPQSGVIRQETHLFDSVNTRTNSTPLTASEEAVITAHLLKASEIVLQQPELATGEIAISRFNNVIFSSPPHPKTRGTLTLTNYQLIFLSTDRSSYFSKNVDCYIPLTNIMRIVDLARESEVFTAHQIICKNMMNLIYCIEGQQKNIAQFNDAIRGIKHPKHFFAFSNKTSFSPQPMRRSKPNTKKQEIINGWNIYDPLAEYERIGLCKLNGWRVCFANRSFKLCESYPSCIVVPVNCSDDLISKVALFRSKERVPATVWRHPKNGATISRCAQPRIGLRFLSKSSRSLHDEKLIQEIRAANPKATKLRLIDCRPLTNAKANHLRKGGYEDISNYNDCSIKFLNIGNIHVVRESFFKLHSLAQYENIHNNQHWLSKLESSHWLQIISSVLKGALVVTKAIDKLGQSVVVHCSDGWDRTPQICALAQFMMDPYYRTFRGFQVLIEKEWISFGHMFATRTGHIHSDRQNESPIFLVFLDCIWQIIEQYPCSAEFNEDFLIFIIDHVYNCKYGTFLRDTQMQSKRENLSEETISIWTEANAKKSKFENICFRPHSHVLYPSPSLYALRLWYSYYLRYSCSPIVKESINRTLSNKLKDSKKLCKRTSSTPSINVQPESLTHSTN